MSTKEKEQVTYAMVVEAANALKAEGIKPAVRLVRARIGKGSHSTLSEYLQRWREESVMAVTVEDGISETLKQTLLAEFGRQIKTTRERLETQLTQTQQQVKEVNELLAEAEQQLADLIAQRQMEQEQATERLLALERQLAATQQRCEELQQQLAKYEQQLEKAMSVQEAAQAEVVKYQLQLERADKDTDKAEKKVAELEDEIAQWRQRAHDAEVRAAAAEARAAALEKPVAIA